MVAPVVTFYKKTDTTPFNDGNPLDLGTPGAGTIGTAVQVNVWNDKGGGAGSDTMTNVRATAMTLSGGSGGGPVDEGKEVVEGLWNQIRSLDLEEEEFTPVGGATTHALDDIASNNKHETEIRLAPGSGATSGDVAYKNRILYNY